MTAVPLIRTTCTTDELAAAIREADPTFTRQAAGIVWAQWALETGRGEACWNHNVGNVKTTPAQAAAGVPYTMLPGTTEYIGGVLMTFQPPDPQTWFRAFASLAEGMAHHLAFLKRRYGNAWPSLLSGDPTTFATELKARGYYTAPLATYAGAMRHLHAEWMRTADWVDVAVEPNENTIASVAHGRFIADWNDDERRRAERADELEMMSVRNLLARSEPFSRYDEDFA
jgi:hypothetical protein